MIPTLNEARNLPHVFALMPAGVHEVVLVDGNSTDDTVAVARRLRLQRLLAALPDGLELEAGAADASGQMLWGDGFVLGHPGAGGLGDLAEHARRRRNRDRDRDGRELRGR